MDGAGLPDAVVADAAAAAAGYLRIAEPPDAAMTRGAGTALALAEAFCGQRLIGRTCEAMIGIGGDWQRLPALPVSAIEGLSGLPARGAAFVLPIEAYAVDIDASGIGWVRVTAPGEASRIAVRYTAGLATAWNTLPEPVMQGVVLLAAHLFEHRDGGAAPPAAVAALWRPFRRMRLAPQVRS